MPTLSAVQIAQLRTRSEARIARVPPSQLEYSYIDVTAWQVLALCELAAPLSVTQHRLVADLRAGSAAGQPAREVFVRATDLAALCALCSGDAAAEPFSAAEASTDVEAPLPEDIGAED